MRLSILAAVLLCATAPAMAQRASLADRVAALEQQAASNQGNVELVNQIAQLRSELQAQRAQIEELQHQLETQQQTSRTQYIDLDSRLGRIESGATAPAAAPPLPMPPPAGKPASKPARPTSSTAKSPVLATSADTLPSVHGDAGALAQGAGERAAYDDAFSALKAGQYVESARRFQAFLAQYPNGTYAPNALYWLGESYYVTQNYAFAQQQFQALLDRYPTHDKAPGALLKVGLSQFGLKQTDAAEATLQQVVTRYPGTDAAATAQDRLKAMQLAKVR
jgi:tol-pal system protein YbgF